MEGLRAEGEQIFPGVRAYFPTEKSGTRLVLSNYYSFSLDENLPRDSSALSTESNSTEPSFSFVTSKRQYVAEITMPEGTSCYGTGEAAGRLLRNGRVTTTWNDDNPKYNSKTDRLYQTHPFILAVRADGTSFGVLFDTSYKLVIDLRTNIVARCNHPFPVLVWEEETPQQVIQKLAQFTGKISLPPLWSLGYHQCRWSYFPDSKVRQVAEDFRSHKIPCDVLWMDIDYMERFKVFTFDSKRFPEPEVLNSDLHSNGFKTVYMIDPGVKVEKGYPVYESGCEKDVWVKNSSHETFVGKVWPGDCVFPDFSVDDVREWWAGLYKDFVSKGVDGVWNDMNEPAIFDTPTKTMPESNIHRGCGGGTHEKFHNVFGMQMIKATRLGIERACPDKRPFILSRSNFIGGQRYGACWTGDNQSDWEHLHMSIPMVLNLGLSGQPFSGPDIGGFGGEADADLFSRWMGFGALLPFARAHSTADSADHEPWSFGKKCEDTCRMAITRRYRLLPYYYTLFREASLTGLPVARPLFFVDPKDAALRDEDRAFMLGDDLLVVADVVPPQVPSEDGHSLPHHRESAHSHEATLVSDFALSVALAPPSDATSGTAQEHSRINKEAEKKCGGMNSSSPVKLPKNHEWFNVFLCTGDEDAAAERQSADLPKLSARAGSIIPLAPPKQYVGQKLDGGDVLTLLISFSTKKSSARCQANGSLYEDSGDGYAFKDGEFLSRKFHAEYAPSSGIVSITVQDEGNMSIPMDRSLVFWVIVDGKHFVSSPVKDSREANRYEFSIETLVDHPAMSSSGKEATSLESKVDSSHLLLRHVRSRV